MTLRADTVHQLLPDGRRVLVYVGSCYMVIVALLILREYFPMACVDVVARRTCARAAFKMREAGIADKVVIVDEDESPGWQRKISFPAQLEDAICCPDPLVDECYDAVLFNTYDKYLLPTLFFLIRENPLTEIFRFEEGSISYFGDTTSLPPKAVRSFGSAANFLRRAPTLRAAYRGCFYLEPNHVVTRINDPRLRVRGIARDDHAFIKLLCDIFSYEPVRVDEPVVYFEDCYVNDGHRTNDIELLERVALVVGKQNIVVKRHPRGTVDRFTPRGYKVMPRTDMPWELVQMRMGAAEKLFVSLVSGSPISCIHLFDERPRTVLLHRLMRADSYVRRLATPNGYEAYLERISDERISVPRSLEELNESLDGFGADP